MSVEVVYIVQIIKRQTKRISVVYAAFQIQELDVSRPLTLSERAVAVALAISLDCDYFSRSGGW